MASYSFGAYEVPLKLNGFQAGQNSSGLFYNKQTSSGRRYIEIYKGKSGYGIRLVNTTGGLLSEKKLNSKILIKAKLTFPMSIKELQNQVKKN